MAHRPVASEPLHPDRYNNVGKVAEEEGEPWEWIPLPQFIEYLRGLEQYEDWNEFETWRLERRQDK